MIWIMMTVSKNIRARGNVRAAAPARAVTLLVAVAASTVVFRATLGAVPSAPANLTAQVVLNSVSLTWTPASGEVLAYRIEAGSASGLSDIASTLLAPIPSLAVSGVPDGRYFVRVRAVGGDGESDPSNEVIVLASSTGCTAVPGAPVGLTARTTGGVVTLAWQSGGGCPASTFTVVVGSSPGASDLAVASVGPARSLTASAPPGTYYVRAFAQNAFGSSGPSNEVVVLVGSTGCTAAPGAPVGLTARYDGWGCDTRMAEWRWVPSIDFHGGRGQFTRRERPGGGERRLGAIAHCLGPTRHLLRARLRAERLRFERSFERGNRSGHGISQRYLPAGQRRADARAVRRSGQGSADGALSIDAERTSVLRLHQLPARLRRYVDRVRLVAAGTGVSERLVKRFGVHRQT